MENRRNDSGGIAFNRMSESGKSPRVSIMDRKLTLLWTAALLMGAGVALADEHESGDPAGSEPAAVLPAPAADVARESAELPAAAASGLARAAEATIRLMDDADAGLPDEILNEISLPELPDRAQGQGGRGLDRAGENNGRSGIGREVAEGMRENARENASEMASEARENVEQRGRSEEMRPDDIPRPPGRP